MNSLDRKNRLIHIFLICIACNGGPEKEVVSSGHEPQKGSYSYDAEFLKRNTKKVVELVSEDGSARILLSADYQGRVMTSTATGDSGTSFGWINYDLISSGQQKKQFNPVGGEERFWIGPEGGQFSIYFKANDSFKISNWQVPGIIDTVAYELMEASAKQAKFSKSASLTNYSGTQFDIHVERKISLINRKEISEKLHTPIPESVKVVGFETENRITNTGDQDWAKSTGLLSIWLLGMFTPSPQTVVVIPFIPVKDARSFITSDYFGEIPDDRLKVEDSILYFTCDGKFRSKIGLSPLVVKPIAGSFSFDKNILTIVIPEVDRDAPYVNSKWEIQKYPYQGDVVNSYNDGPLEDGSQLGPFYEIESSSPALQLKKNQTGIYKQSTFHFHGDYQSLRELAIQTLGVDLEKIH